jgi:hypothetical protein
MKSTDEDLLQRDRPAVHAPRARGDLGQRRALGRPVREWRTTLATE